MTFVTEMNVKKYASGVLWSVFVKMCGCSKISGGSVLRNAKTGAYYNLWHKTVRAGMMSSEMSKDWLLNQIYDTKLTELMGEG